MDGAELFFSLLKLNKIVEGKKSLLMQLARVLPFVRMVGSCLSSEKKREEHLMKLKKLLPLFGFLAVT